MERVPMDFYQILHTLVGEGSRGILWWQMSIRAVLILLYGLVLIRAFGIRAFGKQTPLDIIIAIIIGSNLSRALTGNARFIPTLAATAAIVVVFWVFEHLTAHSKFAGWLIKGKSVQLMSDGAANEGAMRWNAVSRADIEEAARYSGHQDLNSVASAFLERNGKISTPRRSA
jgi:uncharacterized membrane protein YcaP (DUF421 family)